MVLSLGANLVTKSSTLQALDIVWSAEADLFASARRWLGSNDSGCCS